jgi:hypothetical protein
MCRVLLRPMLFRFSKTNSWSVKECHSWQRGQLREFRIHCMQEGKHIQGINKHYFGKSHLSYFLKTHGQKILEFVLFFTFESLKIFLNLFSHNREICQTILYYSKLYLHGAMVWFSEYSTTVTCSIFYITLLLSALLRE